MKLRLITSVIAAAACIGWSGGAITAASRQGVDQNSVQPIGPSYSFANQSSPRPHVFLIIEENRSYSSVYPVGMPWLSLLFDQNGIGHELLLR
jgi:hypothetical protein